MCDPITVYIAFLIGITVGVVSIMLFTLYTVRKIRHDAERKAIQEWLDKL